MDSFLLVTGQRIPIDKQDTNVEHRYLRFGIVGGGAEQKARVHCCDLGSTWRSGIEQTACRSRAALLICQKASEPNFIVCL